MREWMSASLVLLALVPATSFTELECQIFDETMICDNEKARLHHAEIRTCSG